MKSNFIQLVMGTAFCLLMVGLIQSCQKLENLVDEVDVVLDTDLLYHPVMVQYINADISSGEVPEDLQVEILGPGKEKVYSLLGSRTIEPDGNFVNLGVRKIENISVDNPIEVMIVAKAPGYLTSYRTFVIHDTGLQYTTIPMIKIGQDAPGISSEVTSFSASNTGAVEFTKFSTPLAYGKQEKAEVSVPVGSKVYDANGNQLQGEVEVSLTHFDNRSDIAAKTYPGGAATSRSVIDVDGTDLGHGTISKIGAITLEMDVNGKEVKTFSKPLDVTFTLNPNTINPATGDQIREGDQLVVASFNEVTGAQQIESREIVERNAQGQLVLNYKQPHLSTWFLGFPVPPGCFFFQSNVTSPIPSFSSVQKFYYVELREVGTETLIDFNFLELKNNDIITFFFVPNTMARLDVYDGHELCPANLIGQSDPLNMCAFIGNINVDDDPEFLVNEILDAYVEISGNCEDDNLSVVPSLTVLYKDHNLCNNFQDPTPPPNQGGLTDTKWAPLGMLSSGIGQTTRLRPGERYDFKIAESGFERTIRDIPVPAADSTFVVNYVDTHSGSNFAFNQTIEVDYLPGTGGVGQRVRFIFHDVIIPACACAIWRCHLAGGSVSECDPMVGSGGSPLPECQ